MYTPFMYSNKNLMQRRPYCSDCNRPMNMGCMYTNNDYQYYRDMRGYNVYDNNVRRDMCGYNMYDRNVRRDARYYNGVNGRSY